MFDHRAVVPTGCSRSEPVLAEIAGEPPRRPPLTRFAQVKPVLAWSSSQKHRDLTHENGAAAQAARVAMIMH
jgi:hypothetical protein